MRFDGTHKHLAKRNLLVENSDQMFIVNGVTYLLPKIQEYNEDPTLLGVLRYTVGIKSN